MIADGHGFLNPVQLVWLHRAVPTAEHPPLWPLVLSAVSVVGGRSVLAHQVATCVVGAAAVAAIGLAGRRVAGARAGLLAAAVGAADPTFWLMDTRILSETLYALTVAVFVITAYRFIDRPDGRRAVALGAAVGLAALVRSEAVVLLAIVVLPLAARRAWRLLAVAGAAAAVVVAPWVARDLVTFHRPVLFTTDSATVVVGANCPASYSGPGIGGWSFPCEGAVATHGDESDAAATQQRVALRYVAAHATRLPLVLAARELRTWDLFGPPGGRALYLYAGSALAAAGVVLLRRRGRSVVPLVGLAALVALTTALTYGTARWRVPWEVAMAVLAGAEIDGLLRTRRGRPAPQAVPDAGTAPTRSPT